MDNPRPEKVAVVDEVRERLDSTEAVVLTEYRGLNVAAMAELRSSLRDAGSDIKVYKNTLVRLAVRELDLELEEFLTGPTAIAFVGEKSDGTPGDPVSMAKALDDFAAKHEALVIKAGLLDKNLLSGADIKALAKIAPREVLLARLAGLIAAPMQQFAGLLQALPQNFAYALKALIEAGGAAGAPVDAPAEEPAEADEAKTEENTEDGAGDSAEAQTEDSPEESTEES